MPTITENTLLFAIFLSQQLCKRSAHQKTLVYAQRKVPDFLRVCESNIYEFLLIEIIAKIDEPLAYVIHQSVNVHGKMSKTDKWISYSGNTVRWQMVNALLNNPFISNLFVLKAWHLFPYEIEALLCETLFIFIMI